LQPRLQQVLRKPPPQAVVFSAEYSFDQIPGVVLVTVGYTGSQKLNPTLVLQHFREKIKKQ